MFTYRLHTATCPVSESRMPPLHTIVYVEVGFRRHSLSTWPVHGIERTSAYAGARNQSQEPSMNTIPSIMPNISTTYSEGRRAEDTC